MCLGIPGQIVEVGAGRPDLATVDIAGVRREIDVSLLLDEPVTAGEWVLVHVGFALSRIDAAEAARERARVAGLGAAYDDEVAVLRESAGAPDEAGSP